MQTALLLSSQAYFAEALDAETETLPANPMHSALNADVPALNALRAQRRKAQCRSFLQCLNVLDLVRRRAIMMCQAHYIKPRLLVGARAALNFAVALLRFASSLRIGQAPTRPVMALRFSGSGVWDSGLQGFKDYSRVCVSGVWVFRGSAGKV